MRNLDVKEESVAAHEQITNLLSDDWEERQYSVECSSAVGIIYRIKREDIQK
jgi:hypothetical protein